MRIVKSLQYCEVASRCWSGKKRQSEYGRFSTYSQSWFNKQLNPDYTCYCHLCGSIDNYIEVCKLDNGAIFAIKYWSGNSGTTEHYEDVLVNAGIMDIYEDEDALDYDALTEIEEEYADNSDIVCICGESELTFADSVFFI